MQDSEAPIFLVGAARSGTTMLQYILRTHPSIYFPSAESHFIVPFYRRIKEYGDLSITVNLQKLLADIYSTRKRFFDEDMNDLVINSPEMLSWLSERNCNTFPEIVSGMFLANATAVNKKRWGDKTPYYILHMETLLEMFPGAKFIHLVRDGRDCCLSMLKRKHDLRIFNTYHAAFTWKKYVDSGQKFGKAHPDQYHEIRYEEILDDSEQAMQKLFLFIGEKWHKPSDLPLTGNTTNTPHNDQAMKTPLVGKPVKKDNQQKWRKEMSRHQIKIFEAVAWETLKNNHYQLLYSPQRISRIENALYEAHIRLNYLYHSHRK